MATTNPKLIDDAITEARQAVNDNALPYRFSQQQLISNLNTALREVYRYRPDAYIGNFVAGVLSYNAVPSYAVTDLGTNISFPVDDRLFFNPVVFFIAGRLEIADDEFVDEGRAMTLLQSFRAMLTSPGG